jgi:hypothetical protein
VRSGSKYLYDKLIQEYAQERQPTPGITKKATGKSRIKKQACKQKTGLKKKV